MDELTAARLAVLERVAEAAAALCFEESSREFGTHDLVGEDFNYLRRALNEARAAGRLPGSTDGA